MLTALGAHAAGFCNGSAMLTVSSSVCVVFMVDVIIITVDFYRAFL